MNGFVPANACVWFEIPVTDMERSKAFYKAVLQADMREDTQGPNPMAVFAAQGQGAVAGHLYPGKPAAAGTGATIHLSVAAPLEDAMERVGANGGKVVSPVVEIPAGRFAYCLDPDGNSFGLLT